LGGQAIAKRHRIAPTHTLNRAMRAFESTGIFSHHCFILRLRHRVLPHPKLSHTNFMLRTFIF
jgi:hypothetical protein